MAAFSCPLQPCFLTFLTLIGVMCCEGLRDEEEAAKIREEAATVMTANL